MIPWGTIEALAKGLYDQNKLSSVNKAQSGLLVKRVTSLLGFVKQKESIDQGYSEGEGPELPHSDALHQTLKNAFTLLKEFQGEGAFKTFVKAGGWKSKLDAINKALDEASQKFMINAQMEGLIRQDEYHKAVTDDLMDLKTAMIALLQSGEKTQANTDIIIEGLTFVKDSIPQLLSNQCDLAHDHQHMEAQLAKIMQAVDLLSKSEISEGVRRSRISVFAPGSKPPTGEHTVKVTTGQVLRRDKVPAGMSTNKMQAMLAARSQVRPDAQLMATASTLGRVDIDVFGDGVDVDCDVDAQVFALVDEFEITPYLLVAPSPHGASVGQRATVFPPLQDEEGGAAAAPSASDAVSSVDVSEEAHTIPLANGGPV